MEYKYNIYTCDVECDILLKSVFKKEWSTEILNLKDFFWYAPNFYVGQNENEASEYFYNKIKHKDEVYLELSPPYKIKNIKICNVRKTHVSLEQLVKYFNSDAVIKYLVERGISIINV